MTLETESDTTEIRSWYDLRAGGWVAEADFHGQHVVSTEGHRWESWAVAEIQGLLDRVLWAERGKWQSTYRPRPQV